MSRQKEDRPAATEDRTELLRTLWNHQVDAWFQGERISAEAILEQHPGLNASEGFADLIVNEIDLREALGEAPQWEEYRERFPQFEARLRRRFGLQTAAPPQERVAPQRAARPAVAPTLPPGVRFPAGSARVAPSVAVREAAPLRTHPPTLPVEDFRPSPPAPPSGHGLETMPQRGDRSASLSSSPATRSWASWAAAAWASSTRPGRSALNRVVALKMILAGAHAGPDELARFRIEAEAVAQLQHPNIVQIYDVGEYEGQPFFSLEFVEGGSLDQKLDRQRRSRPREAAELVETLARAMHSAHEQGIVHRDLKPANILLDAGRDAEDHRLRPGQAPGPTTAARPQTGSIMGTPSYMAPEQAAGRIEDDRPGRRRLRPGRDPLRAADRPAAVQGGDGAGHAGPGAQRRAGAAVAAAAAACRAIWRRSA